MTDLDTTLLITGSNSGLGYELAAQVAELGYRRVILAARTLQKAEDARSRLVLRTGHDPYECLALDLGAPETIEAAIAELAARREPIDQLVLNAGLMSGDTARRTSQGVELTVAASVTGHHALVVGLSAAGLLAADARIVVAGSEAARGDLPMMGLIDVKEFASAHTGGDLTAAIGKVARAEAPYAYAPMPHYAMTKALLAWWAAALARRLPAGMALFVVSPGAAPATSVSRNQGWVMRRVVAPIMGSRLGKRLGMGMPTATAAKRYLEGLAFEVEDSGAFYASSPGKVVGPLVLQTAPHLVDRELQEAAWTVVTDLTGVELPRLRIASAG